ncbi:MAG: DUF4998 domain-containing protein [Proteiniphilum sp.]|nr:DUF4998 domain-containing protein [Proteiniphilum sp.]
MKKYMLYLIVLCALFSSCENMMEVHKQFVEGGEKVYAPKLDESSFFAGHNQVYFKFYMANTTNIKTVDLYWDEDSLIIPMPSYGWATVAVPATEEKSYSFKIRTTDIFGNHSLWRTGFANSYGSYFQESLVNRSVKSFELTGNNSNGVITWFPPASNLVRSEVRYTGLDGEEITVNVPAGENVTQCPGLSINRFAVRSFFLPEPNAMDTFDIAWQQVTPVYKLPTTGWTIEYCNSWHGQPSLTGTQNMPHFIFDGDYNTIWHSSYGNYTVGTHPLDPTITRDPPPFTIVIDMGEAVEIAKVDVYRRFNNNNVQTVIVYAPAVADDLLTDADFKWLGNVPVSFTNHSYFKNYAYPGVENANWTELGRVEYPNVSNLATPEENLREVDASSRNIKSRYVKLILPNTRSNGNVSLAEMAVHGR